MWLAVSQIPVILLTMKKEADGINLKLLNLMSYTILIFTIPSNV
jgi:hypothetical protein